MNETLKYRTSLALKDYEAGKENALEVLLPLVYGDLRARADRIFRNQGVAHTLEPTALVHEVYLRFVDQESVDWNSRTHFLAVASKAMRQILIDHHRRRHAAKRGGDWERITLSGINFGPQDQQLDFLALDEALSRLAELDERQSRVVELRFFGGLNMEQIAQELGVSKSTVEGEWRHARAWLQHQLGKGKEE